MLLENKKVLITGAGRGIGRQTAIDMAKAGAIILGVGRTQAPLDEMASKVKELGGRVYTATMDVADYEDSKRVINGLADEAGGIDILVNCAAIFEEAFFIDMTPQQWQRTVSIDLDGVYHVTHVTLPYLIKARGAVVNVVSQDAFYGCPGYSHYAACKAAVVGLTRTLAKELGPDGVRLNCVAPGITETEMTKDRIATGKEGYLEKLPVGHIGQPEEIASAIVYLASPKASYITGQVIHANGGMYLG
ncbi:MAG: SDR family oxidoreductase [Firmicutes bacterium]|jgi:3-oxoacyl-[acyl-carrier protein] reductase|nr:SDR family oxidoreductase [Bacillota bacterium]